MILKYEGTVGQPINLELEGGEIDSVDFLGGLVRSFRLVACGELVWDWQEVEGFTSLLRPVRVNGVCETHGILADGLTVETEGLGGRFILLVWPREGRNPHKTGSK
jgi:hypothetical protein